ncbi:MAG TPA: hypothetical protein VMN36_03435 [Verrucomicrobiales bacterium]|nr:hypothetical protein [Verrucomicrobiales bacterium]
MRIALATSIVAAFALLILSLSGVEGQQAPKGFLPADDSRVEDLAADPQALRFGDPDPDIGLLHTRQAPPEEPAFANFGPDLPNQLLVMAAIVASSALIALRKRSGMVLGRNRQPRPRSG